MKAEVDKLTAVQSLRFPRVSLRNFGLAVTAIAVAFAKPLFDLFRFARENDTFSHVILIPFIAAYLGSLRRKSIVPAPSGASLAIYIALTFGVTFVALNWVTFAAPEIRLCVYMLAFVCFVLAAGFVFLGNAAVRQVAFPFALLFLMVPLPPAVMDVLETFFQHASASAAEVMMKISGLPAFRDGLFFLLPGLRIEVAQECSGIRSTLVLFITSLIAGHLLLRTVRDRMVLALAIVPLAILRNGFRIFSLAWLSVEVNPTIIDSPLHHRGGPIYFALSLIPLFVLLLFLRWLEKKRAHAS